MPMIKAISGVGCKNASLAVLVGLALAAVAVDSAAAGRTALVIGYPAHREASGLSNTGSISHDGPAQKSPFTTKLCEYIMEPGLGINVAHDPERDVGARMAPDRHEFLADAGSMRWLSMEDEMKTGSQKSKKKDAQLDSPVGAHPAVLFPKKSDEDSQMREPKPAKVYRRPTPPKGKAESR